MPLENVDNSSTLANGLFTTLVAGIDIPVAPDFTDPLFSITPDTTSDLYSEIVGATVAEVTDKDPEGTGSFDTFMLSIKEHLDIEREAGRLSTNEYTKIYAEMTVQVLNQATSFTLQKEQARWSAVTAQMQARIAEIQATEALVNLERTKIDAINSHFTLN
jgi:hypothetical protein